MTPMQRSKFRFWNSIVSRFALFFTGLIVFAILLSGYLVFRKASDVIIDYAEERIRHSSELAERSFFALLGEVSNDIAVIASSLALRNHVNDPGPQTASNLSQLFSTTLENKPPYFQIRLIDSTGKEVIRFDKMPTGIEQTTSANLQEKGDMEYFQEAIEIGRGEYYFSRINLNEEYGVISQPPTVTLRAASPVFNNRDMKFGIVIINVNLEQFYDELSRISRTGPQFFLLDEQGQYLYAPDHEKEFGMQRGTGVTFHEDFKADLDSLNETHDTFGEFSDYQGNRYLHHVKKLTYFQGNRNVFLISSFDESLLLQRAREIRSQSLQTLLVVCVASILLSYLFTRLFSNQINLITKAIGSYDDGGPQSIPLPEKRNDEIGVLARSFSRMRSKIDQQVRELNDALRKEKEAKKQRDEFLQNMSHELRTPLNAIQGLTQLLRKNAPNEAQAPIIQSLERSVNNLAGLVYDVLDHQKLVEGKVTIDHKPIDIAKLLEDIHSSYKFEAVQKGLAFKCDISEDLRHKEFQTDPLRLSQIVINLVVNAIKYTDRGHVTMEASLKEQSGVTQLDIVVSDTGVGILPENLERINDRFFRERDELSGRYGGYGLGLSIV